MAYDIVEALIHYNRSGETLNPQGWVVHSTATPGATDESEDKYFDTADRQASAHYFIDWDSITRAIPENEVAWHAGRTANHKYLSVEMCEPSDTDPDRGRKFQEVWNRTVWLVADRCVKYGWSTGPNVFSHNGISKLYGETDHTDPYGYFQKYGKTWDDFIKAVDAKIVELKTPPAPAPTPEIYRVNVAGTQVGAYGSLTNAQTMATSSLDAAAIGTRVTIVRKSDGAVLFDQTKAAPSQPAAPPTAPVSQPASDPAPAFKGTEILGKSVATVNQLNQYLRSKNPAAPLVADIYVGLESVYGVRGDIAFAQMCWETHNFMYDGRVPITANNPAGLGAVDGSATAYNVFDTFAHGAEAQVQHLYAYASDKQLPDGITIYDARLKYVHRGSAPYVEYLGIKENPLQVGWASDPGYGSKVLGVLAAICAMPDVAIVDPVPAAPVVEPVPAPIPETSSEVPAPAAEEPAPAAPVEKKSWLQILIEAIIAFFKKGVK